MDKFQAYEKYVKGDGIELGALCFPWAVHHDISVRTINSQSGKEQRSIIIPNLGIDLIGVPTGSQDFLISSHSLEHSENAIESVKSWLRVIKKDSHILLTIPEMTKTFDAKRPVTEWGHFLEEFLFKNKYLLNRQEHFTEYFTHVDGFQGQILEEAVNAAIKTEARIHFHCFTERSVREFFENLSNSYGGFTIKELFLVGPEVLVVLKKECEGDPKWLAT